MKILETVQTAYNGGHPVENGNGFEHGESLYIVSKLDFIAFLHRVDSKIGFLTGESIADLIKEVKDLLRDNHPWPAE